MNHLNAQDSTQYVIDQVEGLREMGMGLLDIRNFVQEHFACHPLELEIALKYVDELNIRAGQSWEIS